MSVNYNKSKGYNSVDTSQASGIDDSQALAVVLNLAKTVASAYDDSKVMLSKSFAGEAKAAYDSLFSIELTPMEPDTFLPVGSGNSIYHAGHGYTYQLEDTAIDYVETTYKEIKHGLGLK